MNATKAYVLLMVAAGMFALGASGSTLVHDSQSEHIERVVFSEILSLDFIRKIERQIPPHIEKYSTQADLPNFLLDNNGGVTLAKCGIQYRLHVIQHEEDGPASVYGVVVTLISKNSESYRSGGWTISPILGSGLQASRSITVELMWSFTDWVFTDMRIGGIGRDILGYKLRLQGTSGEVESDQ